MPVHEDLKPQSPWRSIAATGEDWQRIDRNLLGGMLVEIEWIRAFEEMVLELAREGLVHGPAHSSIGQEGGAVGSVLALSAGDQINGSHRGHHQFLAKALQHVTPDGPNPRTPLNDAIESVLEKTLAEIMGLAHGYCGGRGGSMHLRWKEAGALGTNAIVGGGVPFAAGTAWSLRHAGTNNVAVTYFGDGAVNIGSVLETMNLAAAWRLPLCFFIENNLYAVATKVEESTAEPRLSARGQGFHIPAWRVDGMDPLAVYLAMGEALAHMRGGGGPAIVEAEVYRFFHQNGPFPGSAFGYRSKNEEAAWRARDPLDLVEKQAIDHGLLSSSETNALRQCCRDTMSHIASRLTERNPAGKRTIPAALWPRREFCDAGIRSDAREFEGVRYLEFADSTGPRIGRKFVDVIADVLARRMETDETVVVLGEDIHRLKGGTNGATRGLKEQFPDRVLGTPISENAFVGLGGGMAMSGLYRPIVEFMYADFMWVAADQVFNQIGKARHMFGGDIDMPLVLRAKVAMGTGYGSQHSLDPAGIFATSPGWRIVAPSTPFDYVGLMNTAIRSNDPVLVLEHVDLYNGTGLVPEDDLDFCIPFGKAAIRRSGAQVTVLTYLSMVERCLEAAEETGIDAEVIDLRTLDRASLDWATIEASVQKTHNVLIVEQGARGTSYGSMLADEVQRRCFHHLDGPVQRVSGGEASPTISKILERAACAGKEEVIEALRTHFSGSV
jgi:2-oxoisovalerate dehydrogenase E1 component